MYPALDGGCAAMASLYNCLDRVAKTDHIYIATPKHPYVQDAYPRDLPVPLKQLNVDTRIRPVAAFWALMTGRNYNLSRFHCKKVVRKLKHLLAGKRYDVVVLESIFLASYIPVFRAAGIQKIIIRTHNVEHLLWEQWAKQASGLKKAYLSHLARTLKREEIKLLRKANEVWAITDVDEARLQALVPEIPVSYVRVAVAVSKTQADYSSADFFHVGSLNWQPNLEAVQRLERLWQQMKRPPESQLHIAGSFGGPSNPLPHSVSDSHSHSVHRLGYVVNLPEFMQHHGVLCSPVISGSGVRIKLLEAMGLGVPCITTPLGASGILNPDEVMVVGETDQELIAGMERLSGSERLRTGLGISGKEYVGKYHSFTAVTAQLRSLLGV